MSDVTHRSFEVSEIDNDCHVLNPPDVCSIVQMLNDLVALDETTRVKKIQLMQCLADLTHTDCWVWTLVSPTKVGEKILAVDVLHGGFDDARFLSSYLSERFAKPLLVVFGDRGDNRGNGGDNVSGVESAA